MTVFVVRRIAHGVVVMLAVTLTVFLVTRLLTDPVQVMTPIGASPAEKAALTAKLGLSHSLWSQLGTFLDQLVHGDFGRSYWQDAPALSLVWQRLPKTFELVGAGLLIALVVFVPLGMWASLRPGRAIDSLISAICLTSVSIAPFWLGTMLILGFSEHLGWFPSAGSGGLRYLVLPAITLAMPMGGRIALITRVTMVEQWDQTYVVALRARGYGTRRIIFAHLLRNVMVPILTLASYEVAFALAGYAVVVETVFAWPGFGQLAIQAVQQRDIVLLQAVVFIAALFVVAANLVADVACRVIDPRTKVA
jgi:peptide/nickel transport system permease protein